MTFIILQLYERREKCIKNDDEKGKWCSISHKYMTEESESDGETVRQHKLRWRSDGMKLAMMVNTMW